MCMACDFTLFSTVSISVISGQRVRGVDNVRLCAVESRLRLKRFKDPGIELGMANSAGPRLTFLGMP